MKDGIQLHLAAPASPNSAQLCPALGLAENCHLMRCNCSSILGFLQLKITPFIGEHDYFSLPLTEDQQAKPLPVQTMKKNPILHIALAPTMLILTLANPTNAATLVGFEAESAVLSTTSEWVVGADTNALGGGYITYPTSNGGQMYSAPTDAETDRMATYSVTLAAGTYDLYARLLRGSENRLFVDFTFGTATSSWVKVDTPENLANLPNDGDYHWLNLSALQSRTMTATDGSQIFRIANRYRYMRIDAFAFGTSGETFSDAQLNAAVIPEPSTTLLGTFGVLALLRRRR